MNLRNILFLDIETVSAKKTYKELSPRFQALWNHKHQTLFQNQEKSVEDSYFERAGIYAEFGKIISIGLGFLMYNENKELSIKIKVIAGDDEKAILEEFRHIIVEKFKTKAPSLCAHNGKEFDYPYICRRMLINNISIPEVLNIQAKKPWEIKHYDTLELWKFGDRKAYTSLELLAALFDIESSKSSIDGSLVNEYYYHKNGLSEIANYCGSDVVVLIQIFLSINGIEKVKKDNVIFL
jgi:predicted PolB exonuclease-like 3'-5' exonuclease